MLINSWSSESFVDRIHREGNHSTRNLGDGEERIITVPIIPSST